MTPGQKLHEGIVVEHDGKRGVLVGREVSATEPLPRGHTEHNVGGRRVFLADGQCHIPPAFLHPFKASKGKGR